MTTVVTFTIFVTKETKIETKTKIQTNTIHNGDALTTLKTFPNECIDCVITSPPYYALRDYGIDGQLGLEKTYHEYLDKLIEIFREVKRVLKPTGTVWVNLGDSYGTTSGSSFKQDKITGHQKEKGISNIYNEARKGLTQKSLINIPSRFAIRMTDELGFIQRNEIIWYKRNCMPSSAKDRFTVDFEKVYFFTKNKKYYFEQVFESSVDPESYTGRKPRNKGTMYGVDKRNYQFAGNIDENGKFKNTGKTYPQRNKRCVWDITTKPYKESHFAVFPEDLVKPMIQAGCPEFVCIKCGFIKEKVYKNHNSKNWQDKNIKGNISSNGVGRLTEGLNMKTAEEKTSNLEFIGYTSCTCNAEFTGGIVLDLFAGSGTTLKVAKDMNRNYIGIELNGNYIPLINKRLGLDKLKLAL